MFESVYTEKKTLYFKLQATIIGIKNLMSVFDVKEIVTLYLHTLTFKFFSQVAYQHVDCCSLL